MGPAGRVWRAAVPVDHWLGSALKALQVGELVGEGWRLGAAVDSDDLAVTKPAAGDANHTAAAATSSTLASRCSGMAAVTWARTSSVRAAFRPSVSTTPGATALTRTRGARSAASSRVMCDRAALTVP